MVPLLVLPAELYSTAELTGLRGPSWHHLHGLQFTLAAGVGHFGILPHWPSFLYWARPASLLSGLISI